SLPSLKPNIGIGVMATAFGCPHVLDENSDPWVKPIITDENTADALTLPVPDPLRDGLLPLALERVQYFRDHGRHPLRCVNLPSPLLTASLVWEYGSFLAALLEHPCKLPHSCPRDSRLPVRAIAGLSARIPAL
ncbi:MAG: hypothetical protein IMZ50_05890, partial [Candidatus Atribacteria bacterium]|nr:hypothetical protein [Candidatus Atribacteria bacterium]